MEVGLWRGGLVRCGKKDAIWAQKDMDIENVDPP
jgi:hypothetical protein